MTNSMKRAIGQINRRRKRQLEFNEIHNIKPQSIKKAIREGIESYKKAKEMISSVAGETQDEYEITSLISELEEDMKTAARNLQFEKAIVLRGQIKELKKKLKVTGQVSS